MRASLRAAKSSLCDFRAMADAVKSRSIESAGAVFGVCGDDGLPFRFWRLGKIGEPPEAADGPAQVLIPARLERLLWPKQTKVIYGGRGSSKTRTIVGILTERSRQARVRFACLREVMQSLNDSSYKELQDEIERRGLLSQYKHIDREIHNKRNGALFSFYGMLRNEASLKGLAGYHGAWTDEAETTSLLSIDYLRPTMRRPGAETIFTFNPRYDKDPIWSEMVAPYVPLMQDGIYEDSKRLIIECNWRHNPWFTEELRELKDEMLARDVDRYNWIWEGKFKRNSSEKVLNGKWVVQEFTPGTDWDGPYFGADFGYSQDAATLVRVWRHDECLYVEYEAYGTGIDNADYPKFYSKIPDSDRYWINADGARPETISHISLQRHPISGARFRIRAAEKWPGSVEDGISHLRGYQRIVIHPRCKWAAKEADLWAFKLDRQTGEPLPILVPGNDHVWDAVRYALDGQIRQRKTFF